MKSHFDILDFCLAVFFFSVLASGGLSFSDSFFEVSSNQVALVAVGNVGSPAGNTGSPTTNQGSYQNSTGKAYSTTQTKNYGSTGDSPGSTVSPAAGQGSYQNSAGKDYSTTQTKNYGNTNSPAGNTGSPGGNVGAPQGGQSGRGSAEQTTSRNSPVRCEESSGTLPRGGMYFSVDRESIELKVDPDFAAKMKKERFMENLPVTPIYDLVVEIVPHCFVNKAETLTAVMPEKVPLSGSITVEGEIIVSGGFSLWNGKKNALGQRIYEWKIKGWQNGIAPTEKLETLITAVSENKPVKIVIDGVRQNDGTTREQQEINSFALCAPLWGSGEHKFVFERGKSAGIDIPGLVSARAEKVRENGFEKIEPYRKYSTPGIDEHPGTYFSHIVDLENHDDSLYLQDIASSYDPEKYMGRITSDSSCHVQEEDYAAGTDNYILYANVKVLIDGAGIIGIASPGKRNAVMGSGVEVGTVMHEIGHFFIDLDDEDDGDDIPGWGSSAKFSKNCSFEPASDFTYKGKWYADKPDDRTKGCRHSEGIVNLPPDSPEIIALHAGKTITTTKDTPHTPIYRPSPASLMNYGKNRPLKLNAVSCGWGVAQIKQSGTGPEYFQECLGLDTVKPSGVAFGVSSLIAATSGALPIAQSSRQDESSRLEGVIFERDTSLGDAPPAGVVWYSGEPMPSRLKFLLPTSSGSSTPIMSSTTPYQGHAASSEQMAVKSPAVEMAIPVEPKPGLWQRFLNYFNWGGNSTY